MIKLEFKQEPGNWDLQGADDIGKALGCSQARQLDRLSMAVVPVSRGNYGTSPTGALSRLLYVRCKDK